MTPASGRGDVSGSYSEKQQELQGQEKVRFISISDGKAGLRQPGITLRVDGNQLGDRDSLDEPVTGIRPNR